MTTLPFRDRLAEIRMGFLILTRIPVGSITGRIPTMAESAWGWPLAGAVIGAMSALIWWVGHGLGLPPFPAATLAVGTGVLVTGGLHEDGLADLFDGFGGGRDKPRVLDIMRDSRIGSYGALALGLSLLIRISALASLGPCNGALALIGLAAASRAGLPLALRIMPSARDDGLGKAARGVSAFAALTALTLGLLALLPLGLHPALLTAAVMAAASLVLARWAVVRIGGQTGDVLGAMSQIGEVAGWLTVSALLHNL